MRVLKSGVPFDVKRREYDKLRSNAPIRWEGLTPDYLLTQLQDELNTTGVFCLSERPDHMTSLEQFVGHPEGRLRDGISSPRQSTESELSHGS
jgi:hypothetical protein